MQSLGGGMIPVTSVGRPTAQRGFTLIEVIVVIAVVAIMMGITVSFISPSPFRLLQQEARHVIAVVRFAYNEAATQNRVHRIVFDLNENSYWVEEGGEDFVIGAEDGNASEAGVAVGDETEPEVVNEETEAGSEVEGEAVAPDTPTTGASDFIPVDDSVAKKVVFHEDIQIKDIYVSHQEGPIDEGHAYLYFFPTGLTEEAVIHFSDLEEELNYSIIVNPITGRARVEPDYIEYNEIHLE